MGAERKQRYGLLVLIGLLGAFYRFSFLHEPYYADEADTFLFFAHRPIWQILTDYSYPNNHFLHTLLMHGCYRLFGVSEIGLRLPVFTAGVIVIFLTYWTALQATEDWRIGCLAATLAALSQTLVHFSFYARGYMIQSVFVLLMLGISLGSWVWKTPLRILTVFGGLGILLFFTIPSGIILWLPLALYWLVTSQPEIRRQRKSVISTIGVTAVFVIAVYGRFGENLRSFSNGTGGGVTVPGLRQILTTVPVDVAAGVAPMLLGLLVLFAGLVLLCRRNKRNRIFIPCLLLYIALLIPIHRFLPFLVFFPRSYSILYPLAYIAMATAVIEGWDWMRHAMPRRSQWAFFVLLMLWGAADGWAFVKNLADSKAPTEIDRRVRFDCRALTRIVASQVVQGDRLNGVNGLDVGTIGDLDSVAAFYTVESKGFQGFYGMRYLYRQNVKTIYLLGDPSHGPMIFYQRNLDSRLWTEPVRTQQRGLVSAWRTDRRSRSEPLPKDIRGYAD